MPDANWYKNGPFLTRLRSAIRLLGLLRVDVTEAGLCRFAYSLVSGLCLNASKLARGNARPAAKGSREVGLIGISKLMCDLA